MPDQCPDDATPVRRWLVLVVLMVGMVVVMLESTVLQVAVPTIRDELGASLSSVQWVLSGYALTFASLQVAGGRIGDLFGPRRLFVVGILVFSTGSLVASLADDVTQLIVGKAVVQGIGAALVSPCIAGIVSNTFRGPERAHAYALWGTAIGAAVSFGPLLGGFVTEYHSWRWGFRVSVVAGPLVALAGILLLPRDAPGRRARMDVLGAVLLATSTFGAVFALSQAPAQGWWRPLGGRSATVVPWALVGSLVLAVACVALQRAKERQGRDPLFLPSQFRHLGFRYGMVTATALAFGQFVLTFGFSVSIQETRSLDPMETGLWLLPMGIAVLVGAQAGGWLSRVVGTVVLVRAGLAAFALGLVAMSVVLTDDVGFLEVGLAMVPMGLGVGASNAQLNNLVLADVDPDKAGVASGMLNTARMVAAALGSAVVGAVLAVASARWALALAAVVVAGGALSALLIPTDRLDDEDLAELVAVPEPA